MGMRLNLLFVCEQTDACLRFQECLKREGFQLVMAGDSELAARTLLSACPLDAVLIHQNDINRGSTIGSGFKIICPLLPILLVSSQSPSNGLLPSGVDALCYSNFLGQRSARDIAKVVRCLLADSPGTVKAPLYNERRCVPQKPTYLN